MIVVLRKLLTVACVLALCTGCGVAQDRTTSAPVSPSAVASGTPASPAGSSSSAAPASSTPSAAAVSSAPVDPAGAIDASAHQDADFASPSGRIQCHLDTSMALCIFPVGMNRTGVPDAKSYCPEAYANGFEVNTVVLRASIGWACTEDPWALPYPGIDRTKWADGGSYPTVSGPGWTFVTLPYGMKLRHSDFVCDSETDGVTCANLATGVGFKIALEGVTLF